MVVESSWCLCTFFSSLRTDKWAETETGTKWGDKWEEKFFGGVGSRQGETWHVTPAGERMSHTFFSGSYNVSTYCYYSKEIATVNYAHTLIY